MKTISPFNNTPTIVHITEMPPLNGGNMNFGFNPGKLGDVPTLRVNVNYSINGADGSQIKIATYDSIYKISGEGLVLEEHIYECCLQAVYAMKMFLKFNEVGRTIPQELIQCPGKEAFEGDLIELAKALNAIEGKRGFPFQKD